MSVSPRCSTASNRSAKRFRRLCRVDLIEGHGERLWPRPGRIFAAARSHTFGHLADAIDTAFSRWDRSHLTLFEFADGSNTYAPVEWDEPPERGVFDRRLRLSRLNVGEQFLYTFDIGDDWTHLCTVGDARIDPLEMPGIIPDQPLPYWGGGPIPDQYRRRSLDDDGQTPLGPNPDAGDLPPLRPHWGPPPRT